MDVVIARFEKEAITASGKVIPKFRVGDTLRVHHTIKEGIKERVQIFEGLCKAQKRSGFRSSVIVRKVSIGVEKSFPLYSPFVRIENIRQGIVRRAKLNYMNYRRGKSTRVRQRITRSPSV